LALAAAGWGLPRPAASAAEEIRIRFTWGGGTAKRWDARAGISDGGQLTDGRSLGLQADAPGSVFRSDDGRGAVWHVQPRIPRSFDALEITATADVEAVLTLELIADRDPLTRKVFEIPFRQLITEGFAAELDTTGNRVTARRAPGDKLRTFSDHDGVLFQPGEAWALNVVPQALGISARTSLRCECSISKARQTGVLWRQEQTWRYEENNEFTGVETLEIPIPTEEGIYDLHLVVYRRGLTATFALSKPVATRTLQFVVLARHASLETAAAGPGTVVADFNPAHPSWFDRFATLPQWKLLPRLRQGRLGNSQLQPWDHDGRQWSRLSPQGWVAFPLPIAQPGQPHAVEIEFPADMAQDASISVIEPDAQGGLANRNLDSGIIVSDRDLPLGEEVGPSVVHRLVFWPRSKSPLVLITNQQQQGAVVFGAIRVLAYDRHLPPEVPPGMQFRQEPATRLANGSQSAADAGLWNPIGEPAEAGFAVADEGQQPERRLRLAHFDNPSFVRNFMATESVDGESDQPFEDWQTFYEGGTRLVEYLKFAGYDGVSLGVISGGGGLFPSQLFQPTPKHDRGIFFSSGQDPVEKDVLEMLFRLFDREGLRLIPVVSFSSRLPALEAQCRDTNDARGAAPPAGIAMLDAAGYAWSDRNSFDGDGPYYNPLDPRVQQVMGRAIDELVRRYGGHRSFAGVNINCLADGYSQLPDVDWGMDAATVGRFQAWLSGSPRRVGQRELGGEPTDAFLQGLRRAVTREREELSDSERKLLVAWLQWRADQLTRFYADLAADLHRGSAGQLYLSTFHLLRTGPLRRWSRTSLQHRSEPAEAFLELGIDLVALAQASGVVVLQPYPQGPLSELGLQAANLEIVQTTFASRLPAPTVSPGGTHVFRSTSDLRPSAVGEQVLFGRERLDQLQLVAHFVPAGAQARKPFAHSLAMRDDGLFLDGGAMLGLGQEDSLRSFFTAYRALPAAKFVTLNLERSSPVVVRSHRSGNESYVYLVNDSPWTARVALKCEMPADTIVTPLGSQVLPAPEVRGTQATWNVTLEPFGLVAAQFSRAEVRFVAAVTSLPNGIARQLGDLLDDVAARADETSKSATPLALPRDPGFEARLITTGDEAVPWTAINSLGASAQADHTVKCEGEQSLRLLSDGGRVKVHSEPFTPPETGRLFLALRVQPSPSDPSPQLVLRLESSEQSFQPFKTPTRLLPNQWSDLTLDVNDFPDVANLKLRVAVELIGPGEVWIDDLRVYDRRFGRDEYLALLKMLQVINTQLNTGDVAGCYTKLGGYWPRFLLRFVPAPERTVATRPSRPPPVEKKPSMFERWQQYVPRTFPF
jgi:hypothetical protein